MRRREKRDRMRRPRAWFAATHPGGAGAPPGTTMSPCEELADGRGALLGTPLKARPGAGRKTPRWSAGRRAPLARGAPPAKGGSQTWRRPALRPLRFGRREKRTTGHPGPRRTGTMMHARMSSPRRRGPSKGKSKLSRNSWPLDARFRGHDKPERHRFLDLIHRHMCRRPLRPGTRGVDCGR